MKFSPKGPMILRIWEMNWNFVYRWSEKCKEIHIWWVGWKIMAQRKHYFVECLHFCTIAGKELSLSSSCIASLYIYYLSLKISSHFEWMDLDAYQGLLCVNHHLLLVITSQPTKVCSLLEWWFIISIDTCWDWFQRTCVLITAQKIFLSHWLIK